MKLPPFSGSSHQTEGFLMGSIGVLCFSFTLPATRLADPLLGGLVVGLGRALVAALLAILVLLIRREPLPARRQWLGLAYVSVVSMFLGFFAWYRGLAIGGVARIGQIQLLQPILTLAWAALLLGERITLLASVFVIACAAASQWTRRPRVSQESPSHTNSQAKRER